MDLKGALGIIKGCRNAPGRKGLGTLLGAMSSHHLRNDQNRGWAGEVGEATGLIRILKG